MAETEPDWRHDPPAAFDPVEETGLEQAAREVAALTRAIRHHDRKHYVENAPEIADSVHDRLFRRLEALERAFPDLAGPTCPPAASAPRRPRRWSGRCATAPMSSAPPGSPARRGSWAT